MIDSDCDECCVVRFGTETVGKVDGREYVEGSSVIVPLPVDPFEKTGIEVLEVLGLNRFVLWIIWVIVVLGVKLSFVQIFGSLSRQDLSVEPEPFTIPTLLPGPQEITSAITLILYYLLEDFVDRLTVNKLTCFTENIFTDCKQCSV